MLMNKAFPGNHQTLFVRNVQRNIAEGRDIVGNDFPFLPVASGRAFDEPAVLVDKLYGKTVQLQHQQGIFLFQKGEQLTDLFGLVKGQQWDRVSDLIQRTDCLISYSLCRGIAEDNASFCFQPLQLIIQMVIDSIAYTGTIFIVIFMPVTVQSVNQLTNVFCVLIHAFSSLHVAIHTD